MGQLRPFKIISNVVSVSNQEKSSSQNFRKITPWATLFPIFCILGSSVGAALVVCISDGKPTTSWTTRPSVILAVLVPIIVLSFTYLLSIVISLTWWQAAESGTTVEHLHRIWDRAFWLRKSTWKTAVFSISGFKRLAIASLIVPIGNLSYNPLFQLSTRASHGAKVDTVSLTLDILQKIPNGLAVIESSTSFDFTAALVQWYRQDVIRTKDIEGYRCAGTCNGVVHAPGISASCLNKTTIIDLKTASNKDPSTKLYLFDVNVNNTLTRNTDNYLQVTLQSMYTTSTTADCLATRITETCQIEIAQSVYNIVIEDTKVRVLPRRWSEWTSEETIHTEPNGTSGFDPTGPLYALPYTNIYYRSYTTFEVVSKVLSTDGILSEILFEYVQAGGKEGCPWDFRWRSPTEYILNAMGEVLFRLAMNGNSITNQTVSGKSVIPKPQTFQAQRTHKSNFYKSDYQWLCIALGAVLLSLATVSTILFRSRGLSHDLSLSPLETLQVFPPDLVQAVITRSGRTIGGHSARDILMQVGDMRIEYKSNYTVIPMQEP